MTNFESIFSNSEADSNLKKLFDKKIERPVTDTPVNDVLKTDPKKPKEKLKKLDPVTEKRTIFIGNLHKDTKKEVSNY